MTNDVGAHKFVLALVMKVFIRLIKFLVFELWRWLLVILAGAAGAVVSIWGCARFGLLESVPNPSISGISVDKLIIVSTVVGLVFAGVTWWYLIRSNRDSGNSEASKRRSGLNGVVE